MSNITQIYIENLVDFCRKETIPIVELCRVIKVPPGNFYRYKIGKANINMETAATHIQLMSSHFRIPLKLADFIEERKIKKS